MPRDTNHPVRRIGVALVTFATLVTGCSSSGDSVDTSDAGVPATEQSTGGSGDSGPSDAQIVWVDDVVAAFTDLEQTQTELRRSGELREGTPDDEIARLADQAAAFDAFAEALPGPPGEGELLISRYAAFGESLGELRTAAVAVSEPPADGPPWRFGEAMTEFAASEDAFIASCFDLQEAVDRAELGVIGCVGLSEADDTARAFFELMAAEGFELLPIIAADEGVDLGEFTIGASEDRPRIACMNEARDPVGLRDIDSIAAATSTARLDRGDEIITLEVWAFADKATLDAAEGVLQALVQSDKECLSGAGPLFSSIWTSFNTDQQDYGPAENFDRIPGFQQPAIDTADGPAFSQFSWATFQNVLAIYSAAGRGEMMSEDEISVLVNQITIGGDRRPA